MEVINCEVTNYDIVIINREKWNNIRNQLIGEYVGKPCDEAAYVDAYQSALHDLGIAYASIPHFMAGGSNHIFRVVDPKKFIVARLKFSL